MEPRTQEVSHEPSVDRSVHNLIVDFSHQHGTPELLMSLALGKVKTCTFPAERVEGLKTRTVEVMERHGLKLFPHPEDRPETPIDCRYLSLLLQAAQDPDKHLGEFARGVGVGLGARLPRLLAIFVKKTTCRPPEQYNALDYQEEQAAAEGVWRSNYSSLAGLADKGVSRYSVSRSKKRRHVIRISRSRHSEPTRKKNRPERLRRGSSSMALMALTSTAELV